MVITAPPVLFEGLGLGGSVVVNAGGLVVTGAFTGLLVNDTLRVGSSASDPGSDEQAATTSAAATTPATSIVCSTAKASS